MKILIIGDCHEHFLAVIKGIRQARKKWNIDAAIQVGDFGFYPEAINQLINQYNGFAIPVYVIDGNHEDHLYIGRGLDHLAAHRIFYQPRGTVLELDGTAIGFCGGALNVDRRQEWLNHEHERKWIRGLPEDAQFANWVTLKDSLKAAKQFNAAQLDLIITHSCPSAIGVGQYANPRLLHGELEFIRRRGVNPGPHDDVGEPFLTHLWNKLAKKPPNWVYGHFHGARQQKVGETVFTCVGSADLSDGSPGLLPWIYDTKTKQLELMNAGRLY